MYVVVVIVEQAEPVAVMPAAVVEYASGLVDQKAVTADEIGAVQHPLQKEAAVAIDGHLLELTRKRALLAEYTGITAESIPAFGRLIPVNKHFIEHSGNAVRTAITTHCVSQGC